MSEHAGVQVICRALIIPYLNSTVHTDSSSRLRTNEPSKKLGELRYILSLASSTMIMMAPVLLYKI